MPKLYSSKAIEKVLLSHGFCYVSQKGSHQKFRKDGNPVLTVILPANRKEIPYGTFKSIIGQSQLKEEDFSK
jgi:predicted RNA binding protein YcfA (HicA-like mRNA interferase family)